MHPTADTRQIKILFLGTGTSHGVPMIGCDCETCRSTDPCDQRTRPSVLLDIPHEPDRFDSLPLRILIDTSLDFRMQCLRHGVSRIDAILYTHAHADHLFGLDDVRALTTSSAGMPIYGSPVVHQRIKEAFSYFFQPEQPGGGIAKVQLYPLSTPLTIQGIEITPIEIEHGLQKIHGYRVGGFAYLTDCSGIPEYSLPLLQGLDTLVLGALRQSPHPTHFSLSQAIETAQQFAPRRTYFTHLSHRLRHQSTNQMLPENMQLAHDGLVVFAPMANP